ncbi:hypothetical protein XENORESO_020088 [Xenotaenia resolanae]|uniref:PID domain-containing protein n=1 Tax=Xenotaenia resolanae TaxID=208358 RepID=A0ABV0WHJ1_9TELE
MTAFLCPCRQHLDRPEPPPGSRSSLWLENNQRLHWDLLLARSHWYNPFHQFGSACSSSVVFQQEEAEEQSSSKETEGATEEWSSWRDGYLTNHDPDSKCFAVRSLGWLQVEEEDLSPGRSSLAVSNVIQQLSHCGSTEQRDRLGAWGEEMMLVLKKDTLTLLDPLDHTPLHCQPIVNIRVWGVGCNNGRVSSSDQRLDLICHPGLPVWKDPDASDIGDVIHTAPDVEEDRLGVCIQVLFFKNAPLCACKTVLQLGESTFRQGFDGPCGWYYLHSEARKRSREKYWRIVQGLIRIHEVPSDLAKMLDFAFVAGDKDSCVLKCHVFRCNAPAKAIASALHEMCSKMMSEKALMRSSCSLTMESISPQDLPRQGDSPVEDQLKNTCYRFCINDLLFQWSFWRQYGSGSRSSRSNTSETCRCLEPWVPRSLNIMKGTIRSTSRNQEKSSWDFLQHQNISKVPLRMEVLNRAIESIMNSTDRDDWEPTVIHISDKVLSLWTGEDGDEPLWECQVRFLTFLGVGHDSHTFAVIADAGTQQFECHVFWCEPDAGIISEAVQAACMVQYQKCLVAQTPPPRTKSWRATPSKVKRANSMDGATFPPLTSHHHRNSSSSSTLVTAAKGSSINVRKGMMAFFETFRNKQAATS